MENASTALLIAGGILLGILTISLLLYTSGIISNFGNERQKQEDLQRIANWNAEWEAYNRTRLYGADVLTVWNKAEQNNSDNQYQVTINVSFKDKTDEPAKKDKQAINNINTDGKVAIFKCIEVHYNDETGRIDKMVFTNEL